MYPRGRKVCFATAGFLLIAKTRIYLRSCGIPTGKKRAGLACGIGNILRAGRPSGGQPSFPGRLAGRREAAAKRGTGNAPWRRRKDGAGGGGVLPARRAGKTKAGAGAEGPPPLLCARCARPPPGGAGKSPGPRSMGPGGAKPWWEGEGLGETPWAKPLPIPYGRRRHHSLAAGCRVKRIAADGARISPCAQGL